jgi:hypothetical protein
MYKIWKPYEWHTLLNYIQSLDRDFYLGTMLLIVVKFLNERRIKRIMSVAEPRASYRGLFWKLKILPVP